MRRFASRFFSVVCAAVGLLALSGPLAAAVRAYSARGTGQFVSPTAFIGEGQATHLGRYNEAGTVSLQPGDEPGILLVQGETVYTAANGDELHGDVAGVLNAGTGAITATISYVGGTGRFATASGSSSLAGQLFPDGSLSVTVSGTIDF